jgi:hypothetical protein
MPGTQDRAGTCDRRGRTRCDGGWKAPADSWPSLRPGLGRSTSLPSAVFRARTELWQPPSVPTSRTGGRAIPGDVNWGAANDELVAGSGWRMEGDEGTGWERPFTALIPALNARNAASDDVVAFSSEAALPALSAGSPSRHRIWSESLRVAPSNWPAPLLREGCHGGTGGRSEQPNRQRIFPTERLDAPRQHLIQKDLNVARRACPSRHMHPARSNRTTRFSPSRYFSIGCAVAESKDFSVRSTTRT